MAELTREVNDIDLQYVWGYMRPEDRAEAKALGLNPYNALMDSVAASDLCMTLVDPKTGLPGAILGTRRMTGESGLVWLVGTPLIEQNPMCFLRQSRKTLPSLFDRTGVEALGNYVHARNELHIKWLRWLGFKFISKVQLGPNGEDFYEFVKLKG